MIKRETKSVIIEKNKQKKLFCSCGFTDLVNDQRCPKCGKAAEVSLLEESHVFLPILTEIKNLEYIGFKLEICSYRLSENDFDFKFSKKVYKIFMNKESGECLAERAGNASGLNGGERWRHASSSFFYDIQPFKEIKRKILERFVSFRKIAYFNIEDYLDLYFDRAFDVIECPTLLLLERKDVIVPNHHFELFSVSGKYELIESLIGHKSKKIIELIKDPRAFNFLLIWGKSIEKPENVLNFIEHFDLSAFRDTVFDVDMPISDFFEGVNTIKTLYKNKDEKVWLNRIVKHLKKGETRKIYFGYYDYYSMFEDIGTMYQQIIAFKPDYVPAFDGDITKLHDLLALDLQKVRKQNYRISYSESELSLEKAFSAHKKIVLAPDTHYLAEVGTRMNICVGSYDERAIKKKCTIAVLKVNEEPIVCIELKKNKLIQAKMKYNNKLNERYRDDVISWCKENGINYNSCYDIA